MMFLMSFFICQKDFQEIQKSHNSKIMMLNKSVPWGYLMTLLRCCYDVFNELFHMSKGFLRYFKNHITQKSSYPFCVSIILMTLLRCCYDVSMMFRCCRISFDKRIIYYCLFPLKMVRTVQNCWHSDYVWRWIIIFFLCLYSMT